MIGFLAVAPCITVVRGQPGHRFRSEVAVVGSTARRAAILNVTNMAPCRAAMPSDSTAMEIIRAQVSS